MHAPRSGSARTTRRSALAAAILATFGATAVAYADAPHAPKLPDAHAILGLAAARPVPAPPRNASMRPASTITVANCDDDGTGSLRWALSLATDGDGIDLSQLTCSTITLTSGMLVNSHAISLSGPGADRLAIDGNAADRVLYSAAAIEISDLALVNGRSGDAGGCLAVANADATLTRVTVSGCIAGDGNDNAVGGGILATGGGAVTLVSSRVSGNTAHGLRNAYGAGIAMLNDGGELTLVDSRVDGNHAYADNGIAIGAGFVVAGAATKTLLQNSVVEDNRAISTTDTGIAGGGVVLGSSSSNLGQLAVHGGRISGNLAEGATAEGGGLVAGNAQILVDDGCVVSANIARSTVAQPTGEFTAGGGGLFAAPGSTLALTDALVSGNQAIAANGNAGGGGVHTLIAVVATRSTVRDNLAQSVAGKSYGGGIAGGVASLSVTVPIELHASTIAGNTARSNGVDAGSRGGGVDAFGPIQAAYSTVSANIAVVTGNGSTVRGGGLATICQGSVTNCDITLSASTVSGNTAGGGDGDGGGVAAANGSVVAYNSTIAFNRAPGRGGGLIAAVGAQSKAVSTIVADNDAPAGADVSLPLGTSGTLTVIGEHNLIVDASGSVTLPNDTLIADPLLLPLANNGGATATHALAACSPAVDAGSNLSGLDSDQRLAPYARVSGSAADVGAFERQPDADRIFENGFEASPCP